MCRESSLILALERAGGGGVFNIPAAGALYVRKVAVVRTDSDGGMGWRNPSPAAFEGWSPDRTLWCAALAAALRECGAGDEGGKGNRWIDAKTQGIVKASIAMGHRALVAGVGLRSVHK
uniref:Uncharacterized protein n=1 Tax=Odontella aurita TaxID=265563 RepID=A0A7S4IQ17_9STRA|mmetsp:Transcript_28350/g.83423  ORF Transcript_28350/g.83423 Transcript_28350/m.83423 type:complete len:119 (+) Transcript_28350:524-880(+)